MKYKINDVVEFKAKSLNRGMVVKFDEESGLYSVELPSGSIIRCTEHYLTEPKAVEEV